MRGFGADNRARVTIVEVVSAVFILAALRALWPVVTTSLDESLDLMTTGEVYLVRLLLPLMLLVLLGTVYLTAGQGAQ